MGLPSLTAEVINNHDMTHRETERERERELICYAMSMLGLATTGQIEAGFLLLERAEAKFLLSNSHNKGYPMFHNLVQACRLVGDFNRVSRVRAEVDQLGLIALAPVATAVVQGLLQQYQNGGAALFRCLPRAPPAGFWATAYSNPIQSNSRFGCRNTHFGRRNNRFRR